MAEEEVAEATEYIRAERGLGAARKFQKAVYSTAQRLALFPEMGKERDEILPRLRSIPVLTYLLFYEEHPAHVQVVRIIHQHRDLAKAFAEAARQL